MSSKVSTNVLGLFCSDPRLNDGIDRLEKIIKTQGGELIRLRQLGGAAKEADDFSWLSRQIHDFLHLFGSGTLLATSHTDCKWCQGFRSREIEKHGEMGFLRKAQGRTVTLAMNGYSNGNSRIVVLGAFMHVQGKEVTKIEISPHARLPWLVDFQNSFQPLKQHPSPRRRVLPTHLAEFRRLLSRP